MDVSLQAQDTWERTPRGKIICPECGQDGYRRGKWVLKHAEHVTCTCGQRVTRRGFSTHRMMRERHGQPCPP